MSSESSITSTARKKNHHSFAAAASHRHCETTKINGSFNLAGPLETLALTLTESANERTPRSSSSHGYYSALSGSFVTAKISSSNDRCDSTSVSGRTSDSGFSTRRPFKTHKANDARWDAIRAVRFRDGSLELDHFRLLRRLGRGAIGTVYLAELERTGSCFAIKVMDKARLESLKKSARAQMEREILRCLDHPFLPTLYAQLKTERILCLVMDFCPGGDLHALRQKQPRKYFSEQAARFYVSEVLLALEYLHMLGIIYRDLKPENVLIREDGHIMLSDFDLSLKCSIRPKLVNYSSMGTARTGSSKNSHFSSRLSLCGSKRSRVHEPSTKAKLVLVAEPTNARSMSFVGTHEYMAPEIIKGEGHGSTVDWWTFGIFLYELMFGVTPFKGSGNRSTMFNVVGEPLKFPEHPTVSFAAMDLIRGLLEKEPQHRLGFCRGANEVKQHPFFQNVNWALVRCTIPPEVPRPFDLDRTAGGGGRYLDIEFF